MQVNNMTANGMTDIAKGQVSNQKVNDLEKKMDDAVKTKNDKELLEACKQFEAYFIDSVMKEMRKTLGGSKDDLIPKGDGEQSFTDMLDTEYSKKSTDAGGVGLANLMFKQLRKSKI